MVDKKYVFRVLLRQYWKAGLSIRAATNEICKIEGVGSVTKSTAGEWYKCFNEGDTSLEDKPRSGRPLTLEREALHVALEDKPSSGTRDLEVALRVSKSTIHRHLQNLILCTRSLEKFHMS